QVLGAADEVRALLEEPEAEAKDALLLRCARQAMATTFEIILPFGAPAIQESAEAALDLVDALESQMTVYRDDSEVSRLNQVAARGPVPVEPRLFGLFAQAQRLWRETSGAFDIAVGALIKAWGFYRRAGRVPGAEELQAVRGKIGMKHVHLDSEAR